MAEMKGPWATYEWATPRRLWYRIFWRWIPGVEISVKWPRGENCDPNEIYRPWLETHVGRQGWDWDWRMANNDAYLDRLTIRIRRRRSHMASIMALKWG